MRHDIKIVKLIYHPDFHKLRHSDICLLFTWSTDVLRWQSLFPTTNHIYQNLIISVPVLLCKTIAYIRMKHYIAYYWWLFAFLKYCSSSDRGKNDSTRAESSSTRGTDDLLTRITAMEISSSTSFSHKFDRIRLGWRIVWENYCETTFSPPEAEVLFQEGK